MQTPAFNHTMDTRMVTLLTRLHRVQVEILDEVVRICDENGFDYFLVGGTLLGAVRHKGFIPWDDDLDIAMPRVDYENFLKLCHTNLRAPYVMHCRQTDKKYWLPFAKIRKRGTVFAEQAIASLNTHKGIFIDIFPLDDAETQCNSFQKFQAFVTKTLSFIIKNKCGLKRRPNSLHQRVLLFLAQPIQISFLASFQQKVMSLKSSPTSRYFVNFASNINYIKQTIPKSKYYPYTHLEFEGKLYRAPNDWDYILKRLFGDYMQLPPEEKRVTHSATEILF